MKSLRWIAALSLLLAPLAVAPVSNAEEAAVIDAKFGDLVDVPRVAPDRAEVRVRFQGRAGQGLLITDNHGEFNPSCEHPTLTTAGKPVPRGEAGTWLFPRTGAYVLDFAHSCIGTSPGGADYLADYTIELRRIVIHRGAVGKRLDTRMTKTTWHAFRVPVPTGSGVRVASGSPVGAIVEALRKVVRPGGVQRNFSEMCRPKKLLTGPGLGDECGYDIRRGDDYIVLAHEPTTLQRLRQVTGANVG